MGYEHHKVDAIERRRLHAPLQRRARRPVRGQHHAAEGRAATACRLRHLPALRVRAHALKCGHTFQSTPCDRPAMVVQPLPPLPPLSASRTCHIRDGGVQWESAVCAEVPVIFFACLSGGGVQCGPACKLCVLYSQVQSRCPHWAQQQTTVVTLKLLKRQRRLFVGPPLIAGPPFRLPTIVGVSGC